MLKILFWLEKNNKIMEDTAILITTFLRDDALSKCIKSIRKHYLDVAIFVANTGHTSDKVDELCSRHKCTLVKAPLDSGVCCARNEAMALIPKKYEYIVIIEDDIVFNKETNLETLRAILQKQRNIGLVGLKIQKVNGMDKKIQDYEASIRLENDTIYVDKVIAPKWKKSKGIRYFYCDIVSNVFMMRQDVWREIKWDEQYKTTPEHTDFFLLLKYNTDWQIAFTDAVSMEHHVQKYCTHEYSVKRMRTEGYRILGEKWGVKYYWNSWHNKWGMPNPLGLYTYAKPSSQNEATEIAPNIKREDAKIAIGIKTFMREKNLFKTLDSIEKHFPLPYRLYIADDGEISEEKEYCYQQLETQGHVIIRLPFNSGISHGRNMIIKKVKEDYVLIMDDDILLNDSESIEQMKNILDSKDDIGLCAGMIYSENGEPYGSKDYSQGLRLEIDRGVLFRHRSTGNLSKVDGTLFNYADQVVNFFLAKREIFKDIRWDERIKIEYEHMDFFLNLKKTKWKATVCLNTRVTHCNNTKTDPIYFRYRRSAPIQYFYAKHGIQNIINRYQ